ncbi:FAD-dependent monooxygenase [Sphingomonas glacialis]|uniref:Salicylate 1-monooxygenase n=1 Tax=Sphingomonas glacialis TaxID=658225 RepID=A0A502FIX5_9SPHN|nr:FAD-dependent monooxygenase [Sphingomonas glacialis]TPG49430.1 salicylate 1-monooxygenase [Sphingomonas glacialis]
MSRSERITIVGGGIGGVTAAAAIAQAGFAVTLLEAAPQFGDIGAGVTLSPNAMKGLDYIGVMEDAAAAGVEPKRQRIQHWEDGRVLVPMERASARAKYGAPYVTIHRADLHAQLLKAARAAGVELRTNAGAVDTEGTTVILHDGSRVEGDVIIGADGLKSVVRKRFETVPAHFTGHVAWRALVPVDDAVRGVTEWPGIHIGPGKMITRYPVRGGTLLNMVFFARQDGWTDDGWTLPAAPADLAATYAGWCDEVQAMIAAAAKVPLYKWAINARSPLADWTVDGNVALLGDAAHAMTPFLGHGAACAIEDAVVLARALGGSDTIADGLARYVAARHDRATFIQAESNANADRMQSPDAAMFGIGAMKDEESLGLFDYDCRTVAI